MKCIGCTKWIPDGSTRHDACGWGAETLKVWCAYEGCLHTAMVRRKTPTGWANLCLSHDDALHLRGVNERLTAKGLQREDGEDRRTWINRLLAYMASRSFGNGKRTPEQWDEISAGVVRDFEAGKDIGLAAYEAHKAHLARPRVIRQREPGDDDDIPAAA